MPDYSEYIIVKNKKLSFYNHYRGDYTFLCDMFWGEDEAKRIIHNQVKTDEFKSDNPFTRIILNEDLKKISFQIGIPENEKGEGIIMVKRYLELVRMNWKGWNIEYFIHGYQDVKLFLNNYNYFEGNDILKSINSYIPDYLKFVWDEPKGTLVSKIKKGKISYEFTHKNFAEVISKRKEILSQNLNNTILSDRLPFGGIHVNQDSKTIHLWYTIQPINMKEWIRKYWKNWGIEFEFWGYQKHYKLIGLEEDFNRIMSKLEIEAIHNLKEEIISAENEPYFDRMNNTYSFKPRKKSKEIMALEFDKIIEKEKKDCA